MQSKDQGGMGRDKDDKLCQGRDQRNKNSLKVILGESFCPNLGTTALKLSLSHSS